MVSHPVRLAISFPIACRGWSEKALTSLLKLRPAERMDRRQLDRHRRPAEHLRGGLDCRCLMSLPDRCPASSPSPPSDRLRRCECGRSRGLAATGDRLGSPGIQVAHAGAPAEDAEEHDSCSEGRAKSRSVEKEPTGYLIQMSNLLHRGDEGALQTLPSRATANRRKLRGR